MDRFSFKSFTTINMKIQREFVTYNLTVDNESFSWCIKFCSLNDQAPIAQSIRLVSNLQTVAAYSDQTK